MTLAISKGLKTSTLAALLGLGGLVATAPGAAAHYTATRCDDDGDRCWLVRCDDDGDDCVRVRSYDGNGYGAYYRPRPRWVCEDDGDDCRWVYPRAYNRHARFGIGFGWHD